MIGNIIVVLFLIYLFLIVILNATLFVKHNYRISKRGSTLLTKSINLSIFFFNRRIKFICVKLFLIIESIFFIIIICRCFNLHAF